jgi:hypothetical protein
MNNKKILRHIWKQIKANAVNRLVYKGDFNIIIKNFLDVIGPNIYIQGFQKHVNRLYASEKVEYIDVRAIKIYYKTAKKLL